MKRFDYMGDDLITSECLVEEGKSLEFGPLSLCKIQRTIGDFFQVDVSYYNIQFSGIFSKFSQAFPKFVALKKALENTGYKQRIWRERNA